VICDFADVVVVPFPFVDHPISKTRPALVISNRDFNAANNNTVFAMITTAAQSSWPSDIVITDEPAAGIEHHSVVRWKLFTLPNALILRKIGELHATDRSAVDRGIGAFGPNPE
jgi:mRNA interferase MazF